MLKYMKHVRVLFVHLGAPQIATAAVLRLRPLVDTTWIVGAATLQHEPRENDSTLQQALRQANIVVCMGKRTFDELEKRFDIDARKIVVWHQDKYNAGIIEKECQKLATYLHEGSWIDVTYKDGTKTGLILPASWVCDRGYWHQGVHVILMTRDGGVVLEIRSKDIFFSPGMLDLTVGGYVDAGETPEGAALRELKEELGIVLSPEQLHLIDVRAHSTWHSTRHKLSRAIIHTYMTVIDDKDVVFRPEFSEVAGVALCSPKHLNDLLHGKTVKGLGAIYSPAYHNKVVRLARRELKQLNSPRNKTKKTVQ